METIAQAKHLKNALTPVAPGNTVTVALKSKQNTGLGGIYLFGVTRRVMKIDKSSVNLTRPTRQVEWVQLPSSLSALFKENKDRIILIYFVKVNHDSKQRYIENSYLSMSTSHPQDDKDTNCLSFGGQGNLRSKTRMLKPLWAGGFKMRRQTNNIVYSRQVGEIVSKDKKSQ